MTQVNDQFTFCKCYVMALGKNRNYTYISKEAVEEALPTLSYTPVVAHLMYDEDEDKWYVGGHDRCIDGLQLVDMTVPYGVVKHGEFAYEDVVEPSGAVSTYLTCQIILWTGRYGNLMEAKYDDETYFGQSMEILPRSVAKYASDERYTDIRSFTFSCLTLLGKSDEAEYHVEPCFPSASVVPFSNEDSTEQFAAKLDELKCAIEAAGLGGVSFAKKEEENLEKFAELLAQYELTPETCGFDLETISYEDLEAQLKEKFSAEPEPVESAPAVFELNLREKLQEVSDAVRAEKITDSYGWEYSRYWLVDVQDEEAIVEDAGDEWRKYAIPFTMDGDYVKPDFENKVRVKTTYEHFEGEPTGTSVVGQFYSLVGEKIGEYTEQIKKTSEEYEALKGQFEEISSKYEAVNAAYTKMQEEADKEARAAVFAQFDAELADDAEYSALKENAEMSLEDLEKACFALVGKKKFSFVPSKKQDNTVKFGVQNFAKQPETTDPYGGIREKYLKK